jgi:molecular chaperone GrpE
MGEAFDPNKHEAVFQVPMPDKEPGTVFNVQQTGFALNGRTIRAAKVGVVAAAVE